MPSKIVEGLERVFGVQAKEPRNQERRRYKRVSVPAVGHIMTAGHWHVCEVVDISGGGLYAKAGVALEPGAAVMFKMRGIGLVRCKVVQCNDEGFSLGFDIPQAERERLIDNLVLRSNKHLFPGPKPVGIDNPSADPGLARLMPQKMLSKLRGLLRERD